MRRQVLFVGLICVAFLVNAQEEKTIDLDEVTIQASSIIRKKDRQLIFPSKDQVRCSMDGLDLTRRMSLPRLWVDPNTKSISMANGNVQLRINGVLASSLEVAALSPEDIKRVEYHDNPGLRYGEGIDIVLDYITIKRTSGGNLGVDLSHQLNTFWMADYIYGKYNRGRSEFSLSSFANGHRYKEAWQDRKEIFHTPDGTFQRTQEGIPGRDYEMYWTTTANYNYTKDKHLLSLFGRWNVDESKSNSVNLSAMGFPNDNMDDFLFAYEMEDRVSGTESTSRTVGIIGQVSYMYDMRFSVDFSIRGDLSSQFGANTGMAPFWAAGARWNLHREKWLQNTIISNLVLRGSYGVTGSQSYSPYQAKETYSYDDLLFPYPSSDILGAQLKGMGNPDLGWSTTENRSLAVEIGLWNSRVNASFSYYNNYTDELLLDYNMAPSTGFATKTMNVGAVENEGYDISLSVMPIQDYERQIQWSVSMNGSHNRNVIKKISNEMKAMNQKNLEKKNGSPEAIYEEGKSTTQLFVVPSLGIDPATGQEVFLNRNGEKTYIWDPLDKVAIGDTEPKLRGAVSSAFTYKNWSVSLACSYEFGGWWYNQTLVDKIENSSAAYNLDRRALSHRWSENNRDARYKAIKMTNQDTGMSSRFAQKRNEFSFTSLAVGYRFDPKNFKFLQACRIASVSLNATMEELGRISSIRTERGLDYPFARTFSVSLSVLFN